MNDYKQRLIEEILEAAKDFVDAVEESTKELGAPDMSPEEQETYLKLKDRLYLYEFNER